MARLGLITAIFAIALVACKPAPTGRTSEDNAKVFGLPTAALPNRARYCDAAKRLAQELTVSFEPASP